MAAHPRPNHTRLDLEKPLKDMIVDVVGAGVRCERFNASLIADEFETLSAFVKGFKEHALAEPVSNDALLALLDGAPSLENSCNPHLRLVEARLLCEILCEARAEVKRRQVWNPERERAKFLDELKIALNQHPSGSAVATSRSTSGVSMKSCSTPPPLAHLLLRRYRVRRPCLWRYPAPTRRRRLAMRS